MAEILYMQIEKLIINAEADVDKAAAEADVEAKANAEKILKTIENKFALLLSLIITLKEEEKKNEFLDKIEGNLHQKIQNLHDKINKYNNDEDDEDEDNY
jgi:hypothetical protein